MHRAQERHGEHVKILRTCPQASNMSTDDRYGLNGWARHAHISRNFGGRAGHHGLARPPTGAGHSPPIPCAALHRRPRQKGAATAAAPPKTRPPEGSGPSASGGRQRPTPTPQPLLAGAALPLPALPLPPRCRRLATAPSSPSSLPPPPSPLLLPSSPPAPARERGTGDRLGKVGRVGAGLGLWV